MQSPALHWHGVCCAAMLVRLVDRPRWASTVISKGQNRAGPSPDHPTDPRAGPDPDRRGRRSSRRQRRRSAADDRGACDAGPGLRRRPLHAPRPDRREGPRPPPKGCRVFANMAVGYNNIDVAEATRLGILVTNTPGVLTEATADLAWALILAVSRRVAEGDRVMRAGQFPGLGPELHARRRRDRPDPRPGRPRPDRDWPSPSEPSGSRCPSSTPGGGRARPWKPSALAGSDSTSCWPSPTSSASTSL